MKEEYEEKAYQMLTEFRKINPPLLMRRFKLTYNESLLICQKVWLRQHVEARKLLNSEL